jgi:hypothetical protein
MGKNSKEYNNNYYQKNKTHLLDLMKKKRICECGLETNANHSARHKTTKIHINRMLDKQTQTTTEEKKD